MHYESRPVNSPVNGQQAPNRQPPTVGHEVVTLTEKVFLPVKEFPQYNFVGKLLGPKGSTLKALQAAAKTKMSILGRGSTRDKAKEEELSKSDEPEHQHLKDPLHVLITVSCKKIDAHRRVAAALRELNKFMDPSNEEMQQEQGMGGQNFNRDTALQPSPIVRVGIPPRGAIILNEQSQMGRSQGPPPAESFSYPQKAFRAGDKRSGGPTQINYTNKRFSQ